MIFLYNIIILYYNMMILFAYLDRKTISTPVLRDIIEMNQDIHS